MNKILIIEDEIIIAEGLRLFLKKSEYQVVLASNAKTAIKHLENQKFQGIICDINLEDEVDGIYIIQNHHDIEKHGPVVFLTAYSNHQVMEAAEEVMPYAYIIKPFNN